MLLCCTYYARMLPQLPGAAARCRNPAAWDAYCKFIEDTSSDWERERTNLLGAYHTRLTSGDSALQNAAASAFVACTYTPTLRTAARPSPSKVESSTAEEELLSSLCCADLRGVGHR